MKKQILLTLSLLIAPTFISGMDDDRQKRRRSSISISDEIAQALETAKRTRRDPNTVPRGPVRLVHVGGHATPPNQPTMRRGDAVFASGGSARSLGSLTGMLGTMRVEDGQLPDSPVDGTRAPEPRSHPANGSCPSSRAGSRRPTPSPPPILEGGRHCMPAGPFEKQRDEQGQMEVL